MPRLEAEAQLKKAVMGEVALTPEGWFDLTLTATGDRRQAERAHNAAVKKTYRERKQ